MHISFSDKGKGSAKDAADYLTQRVDSKGRIRVGVEILRGDPYDVAHISDNLSFLNRYRLGVIGWHPDDNPTDEQINEVLNEFEKTSFAGLDTTRFCWAAVLHRESHGGCHVHVFSAQVDLATGKSHNIAPPGWINTFQPLRDFFNAKYGWAKPDDIARMKLTRKAKHEYFIEAAALRAGVEVEENPRLLINDYLVQRIENGSVKNRETIVLALHEAGLETPREGRNYITVLNPESGEKFRLKGAIYDESWRAEDTVKAENPTRARTDGKPDTARAAAALRKLNEKRQKRADYNIQRYKIPDSARKGRNQKTPDSRLDQTIDHWQQFSNQSGLCQLGTGQILLTPDRRAICRDQAGPGNSQKNTHQGDFNCGRKPGEIFGVARGTDYIRRMEPERSPRIQADGENAVKNYDPNWRNRSMTQRQYYIIYQHNVAPEIIQDHRIWENNNGLFLINDHKKYHIWDKGDRLILRKITNTDLKKAVKLMIEIAIAKGWNIRERAKYATGSEEFLNEIRQQVHERLEKQEIVVDPGDIDQFDDIIKKEINELASKQEEKSKWAPKM